MASMSLYRKTDDVTEKLLVGVRSDSEINGISVNASDFVTYASGQIEIRLPRKKVLEKYQLTEEEFLSCAEAITTFFGPTEPPEEQTQTS